VADHTVHRLSTPLGLTANLMIGALVHVLAALVYGALSLLRLEGCDTANWLAAGWTLAVMLDLLLGAVLLAGALRRTDGNRWAVLAGWAVSLVPFVALAGTAMNFVASLSDGCA
jgi:peptidoglycan/LPS O-acetylase OafA/YrhL